MNRSANPSKKTSIIVEKSDENQRTNKLEKNIVESRFFQQEAGTQPFLPISNKHKRDNKTVQLNRERIVYSEDVSRKKKIKKNITSQSIPKAFRVLDSVENDGDFLDNLKKNFNRDSSKLSSENFGRKKLSLKPRALFNDESLKLMNNFKEYIKEKDLSSRENENTDFPMLNNILSPFKDTSQYHLGPLFHNNKIQTSLQFDVPESNSIEMRTVTDTSSEQICYENQFITTQNEFSQSFKMHHDIMMPRPASQRFMLNPQSFVTTVLATEDDNNEKINCLTPPLIYNAHSENNYH